MRKSQRIFRPKAASIETRPLVVEQRKRMGDWEGDSIEGVRHTPGLNSLTERKSGLILLSKLKDKTAQATNDAVIRRIQGMPAHTLTLDNGSENQYWQELEEETGIKVYHAHPYSSWERGSNENANGLVRWYFPKGTDFRNVTDEQVAVVEYKLNTRPRKRLGWRTPLEVFNESVALQG